MGPRDHRGWFLTAIAAGVLLTAAAATPANETDQFTLPARDQFIDLTDYFSQVHYQVLQKAVKHANKDIAEAMKIHDPQDRQRRLDKLHDPMILADDVAGAFGPGFIEMLNVEDALGKSEIAKAHGGRIASYKTVGWIYLLSHFPFDPRRIVLLDQSSTIRIGNVYFGVDKLGHFHDLGHIYYSDYMDLRRDGVDEKEAVRRVVDWYSNGPISESMFIGAIIDGISSNGDQAADYLGFKFYRNLTETVKIQGADHPPLVVRQGEFWRLNDYVRPESRFMSVYFTDHLNEALNPCLYEIELRPVLQWRLRDMKKNILAFYADPDGKPRDRQWFVDKMKELSTYYGEDYGYHGPEGVTVNIADCCFGD